MRTFNKIVGSTCVIDTGLLLEYLSGSEIGRKIDELIFKNEFVSRVYISPLTLIEIYYLIRRKSDIHRANVETKKMRNLVVVYSIVDIYNIIGEIKASSSIALADSSSIGIAEHLRIPVLFKHEYEIDEILKNEEKNVYFERIVFFDDFVP